MTAPAVTPGQRQPAAREVGGVPACVVEVEGRVHVFADRCPHRGHPLSRGSLNGRTLTCALHGWEFDVETGEAISPRAPFGLERIESP